jgi:uncharacterized protein YkwD
MKNLLFILMLIPSVLFGQTKLDSLIFQNINKYRDSLGLNPVEFDSIAFKSASVQSDTMKSKGVVGHDNYGVFKTVYDRYTFFGGKLVKPYKIGEVCNFVPINLKGEDFDKLAKAIVKSWIGSEEHNKILIDPMFSKVGVSSKLIIRPSGLKNVNNYEAFSTAIFVTK